MTTTLESDRLRALQPRAIWQFLRRQPPSFWLVLVYLFFEYVRPQTIKWPGATTLVNQLVTLPTHSRFRHEDLAALAEILQTLGS